MSEASTGGDPWTFETIDRVDAFTTKDGSKIRELLSHRNSSIRAQSLAEARLPPGRSTTPHYHARTEEIYYVLEGRGAMEIDGASRECWRATDHES